jgi:hypothetical protein
MVIRGLLFGSAVREFGFSDAVTERGGLGTFAQIRRPGFAGPDFFFSERKIGGPSEDGSFAFSYAHLAIATA